MQTYTNGNGKSHSDTSSHGRGEGAHVNQPRVDQYYASEVFNERVMQQRLPKDVFRRIQQTINHGDALDAGMADVVAAAMKDWAIEKGATHYTHWFQPLTGQTAEKHDAFMVPRTTS